MELITELERGLPRLAWLAIIDLRRDTTTVLHGASVEANDRFVVEGVWGGEFPDGGFAGSETFFGSGIEVGPRGVIVSPSRALVDRVFSCETEAGFVVANSLPLLLFATGSTLYPDRTYQHETHTIMAGIHEYDAAIPARSREPGRFRQHYYHAFSAGADGLHTMGASEPPRFRDYGRYSSFLGHALNELLRNSRHPDRAAPLEPRVTVSRGYDSSAVAVLTSRLIAGPAYTARHSNSLIPAWFDREASLDDGTQIAERLGLAVRRLEPGPPELDERLFLASGTGDAELIFGTLVRDALAEPRPTVLLSGYHGDKVWARDPGRRYVTPDLRRGDISGLALSEVRLWAGIINVAVPFIGARGIESIARISKSPEMAPWSIGGEYDRPIPRRIVEEAGIPREWFGHRKRAVLQTQPVPSTPTLRPAFGRWLEDQNGMTLGRYRLLVRAGLVRWAGLRTAQKLLPNVVPTEEPTRWAWVPGGDPASLLYRWAVSELTGRTSPFPPDIRHRVRAHIARSSGRTI